MSIRPRLALPFGAAATLARTVSPRTILSRTAALVLTGLALCVAASPARAVYATPGTGDTYTLTDLVALSGGAVTGAAPDFELHDTLIISASDRLVVDAGTRLEVQDTAGLLRLEVNGSLSALGAADDSIRFVSATGAPGDWDGIDYRDTTAGSSFAMEYCVIEDATVAIDVVSADVHLAHCAIRRSEEKAFDLTASNSILRDSVLEDNQRQTIYMTLSSSPVIEGNLIRRNNLLNASPYPYINIGLQGINSPVIRGNTILGGTSFRSGGISIWNECHGVIQSNHIEGCGYGILCYQTDASPLIDDNTLLDNTTNPDTVNWGFGIACNGENAPVIARNRIQGHYYGIAIINGGQPNVGDLGNADPLDDGGNQFLGNGLGETLYELYDNGDRDIKAENNWWGTMDPQEVEDRIVHSVDNPLLGTVDFDPLQNVTAIGSPESAPEDATDLTAGKESEWLTALRAHPNPTVADAVFSFRLAGPAEVTVQVFTPDGRRLRTLGVGSRSAGEHHLTWDGRDDRGVAVPAGVYLLRATSPHGAASAKVQVVR